MTAQPPMQQSPIIATVTGDDLLKRLDSVSEKLGDLIGKVDNIPHKIDSIETVQKDHEGRIRVLESWRWKGAGVASVLSAGITGTIVAIIVRTLGKG